MAQARSGFDYGAPEMTWDEEFEIENIPLKKRFKLLAPSRGVSITSNLKSRNLCSQSAIVGVSAVGNSVNRHFCSKGLQSDCSFQKQIIETVKEGKSQAADTGDVNKDSPEKHVDAVGSEKVNSAKSNTKHKCASFEVHASVKVECDDNLVESSRAACLNGSSLVGIQAFDCETKLSAKHLDDLDNAELKERLALPMSEHLGFASAVQEESSAIELKDQTDTGLNLGSSADAVISSSEPHQAFDHIINIKKEPSYDGLEGSNGITSAQISIKKLVPVKSGFPSAGEGYEDVLDHMLLRERMKLFSTRGGPSQQNSKGLNKIGTSSFGHIPVGSKPSEPQKVIRLRRRRRTVTSSVKTALDEDAPGLLKVLIEKGISVDEFKLYDGPDDLDDSSAEGNFVELEETVMQIFCKRDSILKLGHLGCFKGEKEKPSYCLECLFSLVEQARYLIFRKWPVEWGWCRDLLAFIFVFERHNRIVLERPEYGYATYFFELVDFLPIEWQIKRLITAMKLTGCGRITLLENKPLKIGEDLTEGEAKVLSEYGWIPNTGLGTMLNYYERVVHDRKNEVKDISEWRAKIGKLLMDGYSGGKIISAGVPREVREHSISQPLQIKLEDVPRDVAEDNNISQPQQVKLELS